MALVVFCFLLLDLLSDLSTGKIPNGLNGAGLAAGVALQVQKEGMAGVISSAGAVAMMFGITLLLFVFRALRGGDGKMLCALAALQGFEAGKKVLLVSLFVAAFLGVICLLKHRHRICYTVPVMMGELIYMSGVLGG